VMLLPAVFLLTLALLGGDAARLVAGHAAMAVMHPDGPALLGLAARAPVVSGPMAAPPAAMSAWISVVAALCIAGFSLGGAKLPKFATAATKALLQPVFAGLEALHSGVIGDYVAWVSVGLALFAAAFMLV
jgi:hypothetical protein